MAQTVKIISLKEYFSLDPQVHLHQRWVDIWKISWSPISIISVSYRIGALDIVFFDMWISYRWQVKYQRFLDILSYC